VYATRTDWQLGDPVGRARIWLSDRIDWLALRHFGHAGEVSDADGGVIFETDYADSRQMVSWVLGLGEQARIEAPEELVGEARERLELVTERHSKPPELASRARRRRQAEPEDEDDGREAPIRPERFARLVTLAGILIDAARESRKLDAAELCETLQVNDQELRQDIDVLNVVNFGGGSYVLYAEVQGDQIEVDPEPYGDNFARPARLLPLEAKALVAAIDLIGEHLPEGSLASARQKIVDALGQDPAEEGLQITTAKGDDSEVARAVSGAIVRRRQLRIEYYKENEDEFTERTIEPYKLVNGQEGWYIHSWDLEKDAPRSYRLDRVREVEVLDEKFEPRPGVEPDVHGWLSTGEVESGSSARIWVSPERARWVREDHPGATELSDGAVIFERTYASYEWLAREILKEAGDAVVLEPEAARRAVLEAAEHVAITA
jgi:proteasome accessory factor C